MNFPDELLKRLGIMQTEIEFVNPKKIMVRFKDSSERQMENVTSIAMRDGPITPQIHIHYKELFGDEVGEGGLSAPLQEMRSIIVLD